MSFYSTGTVTVTQGSNTVTGDGTAWFATLQQGWMFVGPDGKTIGIASVTDDETLTLTRPYGGATAAAQGYECFPTQALARSLTEQIRTIISSFQGMIDGVGAGLFPNFIKFQTDQDTGVRRVGSNKGALTAGGVDILEFTASGIGGVGVQSGPADAGNKLMKAGAGNLLLNDENATTVANAAGSDDVDLLRVSGLWRYHSGTANAPSAAGLVFHLCRMAGTDSDGRHIQIGFGHKGEIWSRFHEGLDGTWSPWVPLLADGASPSFAELSFNGNKIGGDLVTVADQAVGTVTPPRKGGFLVMTAAGSGDFPQHSTSALIYFDVGTSRKIELQSGWPSVSDGIEVSATLNPTGGDGTAGKVTVAAVNNALRIENRSGGPTTFNLTFL